MDLEPQQPCDEITTKKLCQKEEETTGRCSWILNKKDVSVCITAQDVVETETLESLLEVSNTTVSVVVEVPIEDDELAAAAEVVNEEGGACSVCSTGLTVPPSTIVGTANNTCADLLIDVSSVDEGSLACLAMSAAIPRCCPEASVVSEWGPNDAVTIGNEENEVSVTIVTVPTTSIPTTSSPTPEPTITDTSCAVCSKGLTVAPSTIVGTDGKTCSDLVNDAATVEQGSFACTQMEAATPTCCGGGEQAVEETVVVSTSSPSAAPPVSCSVCSEGLTVPPSTTVGTADKTCGDLLNDAADVEEGSLQCIAMEVAVPTCCEKVITSSPTAHPTTSSPTTLTPSISPTDSSCDICYEGLTVDPSTPVGTGKTCADLINDLQHVQRFSVQCLAMEAAIPICCTTSAPSVSPSITQPSVAPTGDWTFGEAAALAAAAAITDSPTASPVTSSISALEVDGNEDSKNSRDVGVGSKATKSPASSGSSSILQNTFDAVDKDSTNSRDAAGTKAEKNPNASSTSSILQSAFEVEEQKATGSKASKPHAGNRRRRRSGNSGTTTNSLVVSMVESNEKSSAAASKAGKPDMNRSSGNDNAAPVAQITTSSLEAVVVEAETASSQAPLPIATPSPVELVQATIIPNVTVSELNIASSKAAVVVDENKKSRRGRKKAERAKVRNGGLFSAGKAAKEVRSNAAANEVQMVTSSLEAVTDTSSTQSVLTSAAAVIAKAAVSTASPSKSPTSSPVELVQANTTLIKNATITDDITTITTNTAAVESGKKSERGKKEDRQKTPRAKSKKM